MTWSADSTVRLYNIPGDLDYPPAKFILQIEALTGTRFEPLTHQITLLTPEEFHKIQQEYIAIAGKHATTCKYRQQNTYLRFFPE